MLRIVFGLYVFLAAYCAGSMTVLQLQHFALYPKVGRDQFREYLAANNRAAALPAILPALLLFIATVLLSFSRPALMPSNIALTSLGLNVVNLASTFIWQARIHGQLANTGFDEARVNRLINTNWIRTIALFAQGTIAVTCAMAAIK